MAKGMQHVSPVWWLACKLENHCILVWHLEACMCRKVVYTYIAQHRNTKQCFNVYDNKSEWLQQKLN